MFSKNTIKYIQSLQHKKFRDSEAVFIAEGPKLVTELLEGKVFACRQLYCVEEWANALDSPALKTLAEKRVVIKEYELEKISALSKPNQVLAVFEKKVPNIFPKIENKITLVLHDIQDPGNLGTIIRIADWFGIENMVCSLHTADMYNNKVVQSTMASLQRVNLFYTDVHSWLQKAGNIRKYAAALQGKSIQQIGGLNEGIIIIGNESKGISPSILDLADEEITIPRIGEAESLNAAVATGIILYELLR